MDMLKFERKYWDSNYPNIAGIDEAGRGPLAGPVVASAVIFPSAWRSAEQETAIPTGLEAP